MRRTVPLLKAFTCGLWLGLAALPSLAAELRAVQIQQRDGATQAVVELTDTAVFKVFSLAAPDRVVVDIAGTTAGKGFRMPVAVAPVKSIRSGITGDGGLRLVFDLQQPAKPQSRIEREAGLSRLIVDLGSASRPETLPPDPEVLPDVFSIPEEDLLRDLGQAPGNSASREPVVPVPAPASASATLAGNTPLPRPAPPVVPLPASTRTLRDVLGPGQRKLVIAIDAGHGGKDPGAVGPTGKREKQITLAVARELASLIDADPGMTAVLIRNNDTFVPLQQRYMTARSAQADLFISIHADAAQNHAASGASVYVLSMRGASSQAAHWLADKENAADLVGGVSLDEKDFNLAAVLLDLSQSATMRMSEDMAGNVLAALKDVGKAHKPQIERANFVVLRSPDVPSMLVETGFITNPDEERRLADPAYRQKLASAIARGVRDYFTLQPPPGTWYASHPSLPQTKSVAVAQRQHVVGRGETLTQIAAVHGVPLKSLRDANQKHNDVVRIGERLRIPTLVASLPK